MKVLFEPPVGVAGVVEPALVFAAETTFDVLFCAKLGEMMPRNKISATVLDFLCGRSDLRNETQNCEHNAKAHDGRTGPPTYN